MQNELEKMNKRREPMDDGRRYIIFYTFGNTETGDTETPREAEGVKG